MIRSTTINSCTVLKSPTCTGACTRYTTGSGSPAAVINLTPHVVLRTSSSCHSSAEGIPESSMTSTVLFPTSPIITVALLLTVATVCEFREAALSLARFPVDTFANHDLADYK